MVYLIGFTTYYIDIHGISSYIPLFIDMQTTIEAMVSTMKNRI